MTKEFADSAGGKMGHRNWSFILRLVWDNDAQKHRVQLRPTDGSRAQHFEDLETAFLHLATYYIAPE